MSNTYEMTAQAREKAGKGVARALRRQNRIPAVIYGDKKEPVLISLSFRDVTVEYNKGQIFTNLCNLQVGNDKHLVLARDVQTHPVTDTVEHIDFLRVTPKTKIAVHVPVHFINEDASPGLSQKGILNVVRHDVELMCSATNIPEALEVDMTGIEIGDSVKISNANMPEGVHPIIDDRDFTIATLLAPKTAAQEAAEEAEAEEGEASEDGEAASEEASSEE